MKILVVGGTGTIGSTVSAHFQKKHEVITAGRRSGDFQVDITDSGSIEKMFVNIGKVDAVVCTAGDAKWADFEDLTEDDFYIGINSKLMGQVNLVRKGKGYVTPGGSFTLSTGILADHPVRMTTSAAMVNGAIHSFVKAACLELRGGIRINAVSSGLVEDAVDRYQDYFPGHNPIPMTKLANAFARSVEGAGTGEIIRIYEY